MSALIFIIILSFLVVIHELGHYLVAKWCGVKVEEFGLGYPPRAVKLGTWWGTLFSLNWIPFGGFVKMEGEDAVTGETTLSQKSLQVKSAPQRLAVILAGAAVNFMFGVLAFAVVFSTMGIPTPLKTARIGLVQPESPAATAGLPANVELVALTVGDETVSQPSVESAIQFINSHRGQNIQIATTGSCTAQGCQELVQNYTVYARTPEQTPAGQGAIGIAFESVTLQFYPWYEMPLRGTWYGLQQAVELGGDMLMALRQAVVEGFTRGQLPKELSGPVGIVHQAQVNNVFSQGWLAMLYFAGMLSVNLAIMNVLPIPALDGGRAVFILLEPVIGKKRLANWEAQIHYGGFIVLIGLILAVTARDVVRIVYGS